MMASGTELMMASLFKAMGFNPQVFIAQIEGFLGFVRAEMVKFSSTASRIEAKQVEIDAKLDLILTTLALQHKETIDGRHESDGHNGVKYLPRHAGETGDGVTEHARAAD